LIGFKDYVVVAIAVEFGEPKRHCLLSVSKENDFSCLVLFRGSLLHVAKT
jgi:hypothetical protein